MFLPNEPQFYEGPKYRYPVMWSGDKAVDPDRRPWSFATKGSLYMYIPTATWYRKVADNKDANDWSDSLGEVGATPGGSDTHVQYNSGGSDLGGDSGFAYDGSGTATLSTALVAPVIKPASDSTVAVKITNAAGTIDVLSVDTTGGNVDLAGNLRLVNDLGLTAKDTGGTNRTMFRLDSLDHINIGTTGGTNRLYLQCGTDIYFRPSSVWGRWTANGRLSVGQNTNGTAFLDVAASTTSEASLRVRSGAAPSSPNDGDIWYDGSDLHIRIGGTTYTLDKTSV